MLKFTVLRTNKGHNNKEQNTFFKNNFLGNNTIFQACESKKIYFYKMPEILFRITRMGATKFKKSVNFFEAPDISK